MKKIIFFSIFFIAIISRFILASTTFHQDLLSQAGWGEYIYSAGSKGFYSQTIWTFSWPNHPPLTSLYYGYCYKLYRQISLRLHQSLLVINKLELGIPKYDRFVNSFDELVSPEIPYPLGYLLSLKIFPIIFDLLLALLVFYLAKSNCKKPIIYVFIYLISPFSWYISSLWGQSDQISALLTISSFLFLLKNPIFSIILFYLGTSIKPTSIFLLPLFIFILFRNITSFKKIFLGGIICLIINYFIFKEFTDSDLYNFTLNTLLPRLFDRPSRLTTNAYNFWHIFCLDKGLSDQTKFLLIPANVWSGILFTIINFFGFKTIKNLNIKFILSALFIISFGSWLFLTNMLDRYSFIGIVSGLILVIYYRTLFRYWVVLSIIYWLNLFRGWWYPQFLAPIRYLLTADNYIAGLFLSLANVVIYLKMVRYLFEKNFCPDQVIKNNR